MKLIEDYYRDVRIRFATKEYVTDWQKVEKGIITGCTLSVVLFALAMTWIVASVKKVTKGPKLSSGKYQVNSRLYRNHGPDKLTDKQAGREIRLCWIDCKTREVQVTCHL